MAELSDIEAILTEKPKKPPFETGEVLYKIIHGKVYAVIGGINFKVHSLVHVIKRINQIEEMVKDDSDD